MKVLSITEPYATLICEKKKYIETRSWKTNYRGELYIHASSTKIPNEWVKNNKVMEFVKNKSFNFGKIICRCKLIDCVFINDEFINKLKNENYQEYLLGDYKIGRYAWIIKDIEVLDKPIFATGQLNIWNYYTVDEVMDIMKSVDYGWIDKDNKKHFRVDESFCDNYLLQSPSECLKNKIGVCWDQVELERYLLKSNQLNIKTYFIVHYDGNKDPSHTFLTFEKNNKFYWFEHSWKIFEGLHEYENIDKLLNDLKNKFIHYELNNNCNFDNLYIYQYKKPKKHIKTTEFYKHCSNGIIINLK